jgi:hypothetical protein
MKRNKVKGCNREFRHHINNSLFISICILRDLPQLKNEPNGVMQGELPPILYVPMFPWKYFFSMKLE